MMEIAETENSFWPHYGWGFDEIGTSSDILSF